ncbi:Hypothetical predicted protein [Mytilus galloprovincialis]|uniref:Uncharacterized protein n=1 Tax=Mytilus galloprovincialis TaxID=29158 RepID=A0A8B6ENB7_MYTGA|nr:Hypothetical predicted protein [Mytilus galloprovincialis]
MSTQGNNFKCGGAVGRRGGIVQNFIRRGEHGLHLIMDEFYLFVNSGDSLDLFPENRGGQFSVRLPRSHLTNGTWECALLEMTFVSTFEIPTRRVYLCSDVVREESYVRDTYLPLLQSVAVRRDETMEVVFERPLYRTTTRGGEVTLLEITVRDDRLRVCRFKDDHERCHVETLSQSAWKWGNAARACGGRRRAAAARACGERTASAAAARACGGRTAAVRPVPVSTPVYHDRFGSDVLRQDAFRGESPREAEAMCEPVPQRIVWLYKRWQPLYDVVRDGVHPPVEFVRGIPADLESDDFFDPRVRNVVVLDDLMTLASKDTRINDLFTEGSHHRNLSVIAIYQNLYFGKDPTQRRNSRGHPGTTDVPGSIRTFPATIRRGHEKTTRLSPRRRQTGDPRDGETAHERPDGAGEEEETTQTEETTTNDLIACEECGLVFVHRRGLEEHACGREEEEERVSKARRLDSSEDTCEYDTDEDALPMSDAELEEALEGLPVDVRCAEELPADISHRPMTYVVNTDTCDGPGKHWVAFHFPSTGPAEFFDSLGRSPEYYHRRFRNVLIANGPQYRFSTTQVQPGSSDTCGLYCVHFVKMRYRNISMEDIVKDFSPRDLMSNDDKLLALYE